LHTLPILKYFLWLLSCQFRSGFLKKLWMHILLLLSICMYVRRVQTQLHGEQSHDYSRKFHRSVEHPVTGFCPASSHHSSNLRDLTFSQPALLEVTLRWLVVTNVSEDHTALIFMVYDCFILKIKVIRSFRTPVTVYQSTWRNTSVGILTLFFHLCSNTRSVLLPSGFLSKNQYTIHFSYAIYMPAQLTLLDFIAPKRYLMQI